ncbi:MAG: MFS transporter, partial [Actinomycetota bacterium]
MRLSRNATSIIGSAVAGALVATIGADWALACDGATFTVAAALITGIRAGQVNRAAPATMLADLKEGWQEIRSWVWLLVVQFSFVNGCW